MNQHEHAGCFEAAPVGVAWKLYPPRLDPLRHELFIDNDLILLRRIKEIDQFLAGDCTLLLGETSRTYGRFDKFVPPGRCINSGLFGVPPDFSIKNYVDLYVGSSWEHNARAEHTKNVTFDEQGLVAFALLSYPRSVIIPATSITNCEHHLVEGDGLHFIGLNRRVFHRPYRLYKCSHYKLFL